jgi:hypothetical protein
MPAGRREVKESLRFKHLILSRLPACCRQASSSDKYRDHGNNSDFFFLDIPLFFDLSPNKTSILI